jgi:uncharacterized membrane protein (UPF0127 family)
MMLPNFALAVASALFTATPVPAPYCTPAVFLKSVPAPFGTAPAPLTCRVYPLRAPEVPLTLSVATNEADRERGLMFVRRLPARAGMIFKFPDGDTTRIFWMKNTLIPLDMVFVKADGGVSSVARNVPATTESTPDEQVPRRSGVAQYVIELNAGEAARDGIKPGVHLHLPALAAQ